MLVSVVLSLPSVQNAVVHRASEWATKRLGARVSIDHITIGLPARVKACGFYVEDYDGDTLIYAKHVTAHLALDGFESGLTLAYGKVEHGAFFLRETERGPMNVKEVVDSLRGNRQGKGRFVLAVRRLEASDLEFRLERLKPRRPKYGVDYADMQILNITGTIHDFGVAAGAVFGDIEQLSLTERSGAEIREMKGSFMVDKGYISLAETTIRTARSELHTPLFSLSGDGWSSYKDFIRNVTIDGSFDNSYVSSDDVGFFAPALLGWHTALKDVAVAMHGTVASFDASIDHARLEDGGLLAASAHVEGLTDVANTHFDIEVSRAEASTYEFMRLLHNIAHLSVPEKAAEPLLRTSRLMVDGSFVGRISEFDATAAVSVASGGKLSLSCHRDKGQITAMLDSRNLALGRLLDSPQLGDATFTASAEGNFAEGVMLNVEAAVEDVEFKKYNYKNIALTAAVQDKAVRAVVGVRDEALDLDAEVVASLEKGDMRGYDAAMELRHADLVAMNINRRDSLSLLSANVGLSARGETLNTLNGELSVANALYRYDRGDVESELLRLQVESNEDMHTLALESDFADVHFESQSPYDEVVYYLKNLVSQYMPLLYDADKHNSIKQHVVGLGDDVAVLSITTKKVDPLLNCFVRDLEVAPGSFVQLFVNPKGNRFSLAASSDYVTNNRYLATDIDVKASNIGDSLSVALDTKDFYAGGIHLSTLNVDGGVADNRVSLSAGFADSVRRLDGRVSASALYSRPNGKSHIAVNVAPSYVMRHDRRWDITSDGVDIDSTRIAIRRFRVASDEQELYLDGVASASPSDSLSLRLTRFSLTPIAQFVSRLGYNIDGAMSGYARIKSAMRDMQIDAAIALDSLDVNTISVPDLMLNSKWDFGASRAKLDISTIDKRDTVIRGYFSPSQMRYYARMRTPGVKMSLLDPLLKGVVSKTEGEADVDLTLSGQRRDAELRGVIEVANLKTKVDFTNCTYSAPHATVQVDNNHFRVKEAPIYDVNGRRGALSMDLSLDHLSNIEYNFRIAADTMQVLNTTSRDNSLFYGDVNASGTIVVRGNKAGVAMDIVARTEDGSHFFMPLSDKSDISSADFVKFVKPESVDTTNYLVRKKMLFENRRNRRSSSAGTMDISMALDVRPNAEVQLVIDPTVGDIIKGRGEGLLNLRINPKSNIFEMYGDYTISEGSYLFTLQNIINKWFVIEPGSTIQWTGEPLDALLNIDAVYKLKTSLQPLLEGSVSQNSISSRAVPVECVIHLTDRLSQPNVTFDVVVPSADAEVQSIVASTLATEESKSRQFLYLLVANSFISESTNATSANIATSAAATTGLEVLSNQLSNWLSTDDYNIVLRYRPRTEQMSDEVDFGFSKGLVDNRLLIEVEGNYIVDKTQVVNAKSNFAGEAYVTWLIDRAGTLRLRGFTHTIDRFDENQGLQETGVGIYYKEDYDNARDFRERVKARFRRRKQKKQIEKQERREERDQQHTTEQKDNDK